jgi:hypothetical protein
VFQDLWFELNNRDDDALAVIEPRLSALAQHFDVLASLFEPSGMGLVDIEASWSLYAFSRVVDVLVSSLGPRATPMVQIDADGLSLLMDALSAQPVKAPFHPFFHEIVMVTATDDADQQPTIVDEYWPSFMRGSLLLCRGGVHIEAGAHHINKTIAESSMMYFTHQRSWRRTHDPSQGWGSNSQWRTSFRRDYLIDGYAHYNTDARADRDDDGGLTPQQRHELLVHRCFVTSSSNDTDHWPYNDQDSEPCVVDG